MVNLQLMPFQVQGFAIIIIKTHFNTHTNLTFDYNV